MAARLPCWWMGRLPGLALALASALSLLMALLLAAPPRAAAAAAPPTSPAAAASDAGAAGAYRFRQPPSAGLLEPAAELLDAAERDFLATLPVVRVGLNLPDNRPYEVIEADGQIGGIQIEILTHVAQALGIRLQPVVLPSFPQALAALRERRIDVMATVGYEPAREAYMRFTIGTAPNPGAILGRSADNRFDTAPTLNGRRVALEADYVTHFYVRKLFPDALVSDHPDTASALRAVALGEDDYYFGSLLMATDRIQRDHIPALAVKRAQGVRLGMPPKIPTEVVERILGAKAGGASLRAIAAELTSDGIPTARGGTRWQPSTVQGVLASQHAERVRAEATA